MKIFPVEWLDLAEYWISCDFRLRLADILTCWKTYEDCSLNWSERTFYVLCEQRFSLAFEMIMCFCVNLFSFDIFVFLHQNFFITQRSSYILEHLKLPPADIVSGLLYNQMHVVTNVNVLMANWWCVLLERHRCLLISWFIIQNRDVWTILIAHPTPGNRRVKPFFCRAKCSSST